MCRSGGRPGACTWSLRHEQGDEIVFGGLCSLSRTGHKAQAHPMTASAPNERQHTLHSTNELLRCQMEGSRGVVKFLHPGEALVSTGTTLEGSEVMWRVARQLPA